MLATKHALFSAALLVSVVAFAPAAEAAYTITLTESGGNVVANASGTFNLTSLAASGFGNAAAFVQANNSSILVGPSALTPFTLYTNGVTGPANFGPGAFLVANSGSGSLAGIDLSAIPAAVVVPSAYVSGAAISGTATWNGQTFASLGVTPGTYTWTWGAGANADSLILQIGPLAPPSSQAIPTLSEWAVIMLGGLVALVGLSRLRRQRH
jgi:hypothetical protein